mmetsp:Transcript_13510/g.49145  ORF Transcript_13510/g.49145 Transcript_13510/m.49145 type:complete len:355 (-) Transcript_13510:120-1184(-)
MGASSPETVERVTFVLWAGTAYLAFGAGYLWLLLRYKVPRHIQNSAEKDNPFYDVKARPLSLWSALRIVLMGPVAAVRFLAIISCWLSLMTSLYIVYFSLNQNLVSGLGYKLSKRLSQLMNFLACAIAGMRIRVKGAKNLRDAQASGGPFVIVPNHLSYMDFFTIGAVIGPVGAIASAQIGKIPILGDVSRAFGVLFIDRRTRPNQGEEIAKRARRKWPLVDVPPFLVFPEGTTTNGKTLLKYRAGAFEPRVPVLPFFLKYHSMSGTSWCWVAPLDIVHHFLQLLCEISSTVDIHVMPLYTPSEEELTDSHVYANNVQKYVAKANGVPATEKTVKDAHEFWGRIWGSYREGRIQ